MINFAKFKKKKKRKPYNIKPKPLKQRKDYVTKDGLITIIDFAKELGSTKTAIQGRIKKGFFKVIKKVGIRNFISYKVALREMFHRSTSATYFTAKQIVDRRVKMGYLLPENAEQEIRDREQEYEENVGIHEALKDGVYKKDSYDSTNVSGTRETKLSAEAKTKFYQAELAKLKYLKEAGLVVDTQEVVEVWSNIAIVVRKAVLSIPDRVSTIFASLSDPKEIDNTLKKELVYALNKLNFDIKGMVPDIDKYEVDDE